MRTAVYNAPTGEAVQVHIILGKGAGAHPYHVRVIASKGPYSEGQSFDTAPMRLSQILDDGNTLDWLAVNGRGSTVKYVASVPGIGEVTVKQQTMSQPGAGAWRAWWPDGTYGSSRNLAHECMKDAEAAVARKLGKVS